MSSLWCRRRSMRPAQHALHSTRRGDCRRSLRSPSMKCSRASTRRHSRVRPPCRSSAGWPPRGCPRSCPDARTTIGRNRVSARAWHAASVSCGDTTQATGNRDAMPSQRSSLGCAPRASVAQLDRAPDFGSGGCRFESCRACQLRRARCSVVVEQPVGPGGNRGFRSPCPQAARAPQGYADGLRHPPCSRLTSCRAPCEPFSSGRAASRSRRPSPTRRARSAR